MSQIRYSEEWKSGDIPDAYLEYIEKQLTSKISKLSEIPHQAAEVKDFTHLEEGDIKESYQMMFGRIHFLSFSTSQFKAN